MIRLEVTRGQSTGKVFESSADLLRVGRSEGNDLLLVDDVVSGEHAQIFFDGEKYLLRDQRSTNGTLVVRGAERLAVDDSVGREVPLAQGDVIELGTGEQAVTLSAAITIDEAARVVAFRRIDDFAPAESRVE